MIDPTDVVAIRRALETCGRDGALTELRRRFPVVSAERAGAALDYILAMPVDPPPSARERSGWTGARQGPPHKPRR
ncbi:MAG: hypothetical protein WCO00_05795 [Rhodospirillaceae bacterium]